MEDMVSFWKDKKVFITGHTGFKGSWLAMWLKQLQAKVVGYSLEPPTETNLFTVARVAEGLVDIRGDIRDYSSLQKAITTHQPDIIFHLAAQSLVRYSYEEPVETYATNVMGTVHLLEAARQIPNLKAIVNVTTDKCYENKERSLGYREDEPMGGYDPYSSSKGCAELVSSAYRRSFFNENGKVGLATARAGNVIGGGDWAKDRLVPDIIQAHANKKVLTIRYPEAVRPWQHVLEPLSGYLLLAKALYSQPDLYAEAWNFGPDDADAMPVSWVADEVLRLSGNQTTWQTVKTSQPHEAHFLKLDCSKARNKLNWQPQWHIREALEQTVAWYQDYLHGKDMQATSLKQIEKYTNLNLTTKRGVSV